MNDDVIRVDGLEKSFGRVRALDGLDLTVARGEVHAFLGPNGAGSPPPSGSCSACCGLTPATSSCWAGTPGTMSSPCHRRLAYVPGDVSLWPGMTGGQAIDLLGNLRGGLDERRRTHLLQRFELDPTKRGRTYSKGNRQKVAIVAALASDVELLVLDEPTSGLDPLMEAVFQEEIAAERERGRTVLLSSHILSEAEALADRVSIIREGRVVETGTMATLRRRTRTTVRADLAGPPPATLDGLRAVRDAQVETRDGRSVLTSHVDGDDLAAAAAELSRFELLSLTVAPPSLEDLFLRHYGSPS